MRDWRQSIQRIILGVMVVLMPCTFGMSPMASFGIRWADAQEIVFVKALEEAEKAIQEARDFEADIYAPEEFTLALNYLVQAKDEAKVFRSASPQAKQDTHLFSARKSGEAVGLLAERALYQARVAGTKAVEVKSTREITAIKAQIAESFNTTVNRNFTSEREQLYGELGSKEAVRSEAKQMRMRAEFELRKLGLEGQASSTPQ
jgi:hypothetical protein